MGKPIKIKAKIKGDVAEVKALMPHPMESGARVDADTGETVPKHLHRRSCVQAQWKRCEYRFLGHGCIEKPLHGIQIQRCQVR